LNLVFILYKYFPFGGLQRDFLRIAQACQAKGHAITVLTISWEGEKPKGWDIRIAPIKALTQVGRYQKFTAWAKNQIKPNERVVGFNKMPGLDFYYAADPCFAHKAQHLRKGYYRFTPRFRHFMDYERAVFSPESKTQILMISETQLPLFQKHYSTPTERFHMLPPGVARDRQAPANAAEIRQEFRHEFGISETNFLILTIASDFKNKGLDRSLKALAALSKDRQQQTVFFVVGNDNPSKYLKLYKSLSLDFQILFFGSRADVDRFLLGSDLLLHPAYHENTGTVILEALAAGLPVITTANCGYAHYVQKANAGVVLAEPFMQSALNNCLKNIISSSNQELDLNKSGDQTLDQWRQNAIAFGQSADIYSMPERAADIIVTAAAQNIATKHILTP
jgi:UDP-glucose:(heptosyl)LPS alpha-1,3-glucosyltransferase